MKMPSPSPPGACLREVPPLRDEGRGEGGGGHTILPVESSWIEFSISVKILG